MIRSSAFRRRPRLLLALAALATVLVAASPQTVLGGPLGDRIAALLDAERSQGEAEQAAADPTPFATGVNSPGSVVQLADGRVLVGELNGDEVLEFNADGTGRATFAAGLNSPQSIVQLTDGRVLVVDYGNHRVMQYDADGSGASVFASGFNLPMAATQLTDGRVLVTEYGNARVLAFNADGTGRTTFATGVSVPFDIEQLSDGRVYVVEATSNKVSSFAANGTGRTDFVTGVTYPSGIVELQDGRVLVVEYTGNTVAAFTPDGTGLADFATGLNLPFGIAQMSDGRVLVAEQGAGQVTAFGEAAPPPPTSTTIYVDAGATGANDGSSWANAFVSLPAALAAATGDDEIWIAGGTYTVGTHRNNTLFLNDTKDGLKIYGGFAGTETALDQRDLSAGHVTVIDGDIGVAGNRADNTRRLFTLEARNGPITASTTLDGLVIANAYGDASQFNTGGGLFCNAIGNDCSPTISNVTFLNNAVTSEGGAVYLRVTSNGTSAPAFSNVQFLGNSGFNGGAVFTYSDGGFTRASAAPTFTNVVFSGNAAGRAGGAFSEITTRGGTATPTFTNVTFSQNRAVQFGGAISTGGQAAVNASILWGNTAPTGPEYHTVAAGAVTFTNSTVQGGCAPQACGTADPLFVDADGADDVAGTLDDDLRLSDGSPAVGQGAYPLAVPPPPPSAQIYVDASATGANNGSSWADAFTDLQPALAAATGNDEIWIAEGTYRPTTGTDRRATFEVNGGKDGLKIYGGFAGTEAALEERVLSGARETILSGDIGAVGVASDNAYHVLSVGGTADPVTAATVFDGLVIADGNADGSGNARLGGGLFCNGKGAGSECSPAFSNVVFRDNAAARDGGAVFVTTLEGGARPSFTTVRFEGNTSGGSGGAVAFVAEQTSDSAPTFTDVAFDSNTAGGLGGAVHLVASRATSAPVFERVTFTENTAAAGAGGVYIEAFGGAPASAVSPLFSDVRFERNTTAGRGGGAVLNTTRVGTSTLTPVFVNVAFVENTADVAGGLELVSRNGNTIDAEITNAAFARNVAARQVGALSTIGPDTNVEVSTSTIAFNEAGRSAAAFVAQGTDALTIENSVIWGNVSPGGAYDISGTTAALTTSIVEGGCPPQRATCSGVLDVDPLFADAMLRLSPASPALDAGDAARLPADAADLDRDGNTTEAVPLDLAGAERQQAGALDLGAYEGGFEVVAFNVIYVDADATGANDGSSWADAFPDLQAALAAATGAHQIWIAEGTYRPTATADRRASFEINGTKDGLKIYGGFAGTETALNQRVLSNDRETVLSGDIGAPGEVADNVHHVLSINGQASPAGPVTSATVLDGLVIADGNASVSGGNFGIGGGLFCNGKGAGSACSPAFSNVVFRGNRAADGGGAVSLVTDEGEASPSFTHVRFEGNATQGRATAYGGNGGAFHAFAFRSAWVSPTFTDVTFEGNASTRDGGAVEFFVAIGSVSNPVFERVAFLENTAGGSAGGLHIHTQGGDANSVAPLFSDVRFERNTAAGRGGGAIINTTRLGSSVVTPTFVNTSFIENTANIVGGLELISRNGNTLDAEVTNALFARNVGTRQVGALSVMGADTDASVSTSTVTANESLRGSAAFYVQEGSLDVANSVIWGNASRLGAYEIRGVGTPVSLTASILEGGCPPQGATCSGVLDANPLFADATYRLSTVSPALNAGNAALLPADLADLDGDGNTTEAVPQDLLGGARVQGGTLDLGAIEGGTVGPQPLTLNGPEGFRYLALPYDNLPLGGRDPGFLTNLLTAGYNGADYNSRNVTPNVEIADGTGGLVSPANQYSVEPGQGMLVYVYEDDDPTTDGIQGGFPKQLEVAGGTEVTGDVPFVCAPDRPIATGAYDGCFAGNPYPEAIDWDHPSWTKTDVEGVFYIIQADGSFISWNGTTGAVTDGVIPAGQAFFVPTQGTDPQLIVREAAKTGTTGTIYGGTTSGAAKAAPVVAGAEVARGLAFRMSGTVGGVAREAAAYVSVGAEDAIGLDRHDARSLTLSGTRDALRLYSLVPEGYEGAGEALAIGSVPSGLGGPVEIPLHAEALEDGSASAARTTLAWDAADLPEGWTATLVDRRSGQGYDLTEAGQLTLDLVENDAMAISDAPAAAAGTSGRGRSDRALPLQPTPLRADGDKARFTLVLSPGATTAKSTFELAFGDAYPNPARGTARIGVTLPAEGEVTVEVFDALGRRVAETTGAYAEGPHSVALPVQGLAAGSYVVRVDAAGESVTRRLTVVR